MKLSKAIFKSILDNIDSNLQSMDILDIYEKQFLFYKPKYKMEYWLSLLRYYNRFDMDDMKSVIMLNVANGVNPVNIYTCLEELSNKTKDVEERKFFETLYDFAHIVSLYLRSLKEKTRTLDLTDEEIRDRIESIDDSRLTAIQKRCVVEHLRYEYKSDMYNLMTKNVYIFDIQYYNKKLMLLNRISDILSE